MTAPGFVSAASQVAAHGARGLVRSKTVIGAALVGLAPLALAIGLRAAGESGTREFEQFAVAALSSVAAPLVALLLGTWAMGAEREGGTLVFLFTRPVRRSAVLAGRALAALSGAVATVAASAILSGLVLGGSPAGVLAVTAAVALETLGLASVFVLLGTLLPRALYVGLGYAVLVEGVLGGVISLQGGVTLTQHARNLLARWSPTGELDGLELAQGAGASVAFLLGAMVVCLAAAALWIETRETPTRERVKGE